MSVLISNCVSPCVVISQPMYFPWLGMFEQIKMADIFVYYEDVQFSRGSFSNRVQIKTALGTSWLTVPLRHHHVGQLISQVQIDNTKKWRRSHRDFLKQVYANTPYQYDMLSIVDEVFNEEYKTLAELSKASMRVLVNYFGLQLNRNFIDSKLLPVQGNGTQRVRDLCLYLGAKTYLTGHGAKNYLKHELLEDAGISVAYIDYGLYPYPQVGDNFTPYVSALDIVANCGKKSASYIAGSTIPWKKFVSK